MPRSFDPARVETAGSLTPELEGASKTAPHPDRDKTKSKKEKTAHERH